MRAQTSSKLKFSSGIRQGLWDSRLGKQPPIRRRLDPLRATPYDHMKMWRIGGNFFLVSLAAILICVTTASAQETMQVEPPSSQNQPNIVPAPRATRVPRRLPPSESEMQIPQQQQQPQQPQPSQQPQQSQQPWAPPPPPPQPPPPPPVAVPMFIPQPVLPSVFRGCWEGRVDDVDSIQREPGGHKVGYWTPKTYRLCYKRVGEGPYQLTFGEAGIVATEKIAYSKGRVEIQQTDGRSFARLRAFLHFDEYHAGANFSRATFAVDEVTMLDCKIDGDQMRVSAEVDGRREDEPWFRAHWHTTFMRIPH